MSALRIVGIRALATEIFGVFHSLNPVCVDGVFRAGPLVARSLRCGGDLVARVCRSVACGGGGLGVVGPAVWGHLPDGCGAGGLRAFGGLLKRRGSS